MLPKLKNLDTKCLIPCKFLKKFCRFFFFNFKKIKLGENEHTYQQGKRVHIPRVEKSSNQTQCHFQSLL